VRVIAGKRLFGWSSFVAHPVSWNAAAAMSRRACALDISGGCANAASWSPAMRLYCTLADYPHETGAAGGQNLIP
jgi:hypothetical protein